MIRCRSSTTLSTVLLLVSLLVVSTTPAAQDRTALAQTDLTTSQKQQFKARFKEDAASILKVIDRWEKAWSKLDIEQYLSCYDKGYYPEQYSSADTWRVSRRERFDNQEWVRLRLTGMVVSLQGNGVYAVEFTQNYESDTYHDTTRKVLVFRNAGSAWKIINEDTVAK